MKLKKFIFLILLSLPFYLTACFVNSEKSQSNNYELSAVDSSKEVTLWVITEKTTTDGMNSELQAQAESFKQMHNNVNILIDILPTDIDQREAYFDMIYEQIAAGQGPDIYLLPTNNILVLDQPQQYTYCHIEPLISNVDRAMRDGIFMDISSFYNMGKSQKTLVDVIMDAGTIGNARYVLPLRYNLPVLYVFNEQASDYGINVDNSSKNILELMELILSTDDPIIACGADYCSFNAFSNIVDYDEKSVNLSKEELCKYLTLLQKVNALTEGSSGHRSNAWLDYYINDLIDVYPVRIGPLSDALTYVAASKTEETELSMYPVLTTNGEFVATISYYGGVGKGCSNPEIAYKFLSLFLSEPSQWEINRLESFDEQYSGLIEQSWPVRTLGSVEHLWNNQKHQAIIKSNSVSVISKRLSAIQNMNLIQEDLEILKFEITAARFPFSFTLREMVEQAEIRDPETLADQIITELKTIVQNNT